MGDEVLHTVDSGAEKPKVDDGGPAFPNVAFKNDGEGLVYGIGYAGMSLRDWFAGQALVGMWSAPNLPVEDNGEPITVLTNAKMAELAYQQADAMLAERSKPTAA